MNQFSMAISLAQSPKQELINCGNLALISGQDLLKEKLQEYFQNGKP